SFQLSGPIPNIPDTGFGWTIGSGYLPVAYSDSTATAGLATVVYPYSSRRLPNLVFTSLTGSNEVLQADPAVLLSVITAGVLAYRQGGAKKHLRSPPCSGWAAGAVPERTAPVH